MGKQTRKGFLVSLGAASLSAMSLTALSGCSGGAPPNSVFQGTFRSVYTIADTNESGTFNYSIDQKGNITGAFVDANSGTTMSFSGVVKNNGQFTGNATRTTGSVAVSGTLSALGGDFAQTGPSGTSRGTFTVGGTLSNATSEYRGIYSGVFAIPGISLTGLNSFAIDSTGGVTGSITRSVAGRTETGALLGTISNTGVFTLTATFDNLALTLTGTLARTADGSSQGNFVARNGSASYPGTFSRSESVVAGGDSPYKGSYRGTYGIPEQGENGNLSFTVDPSGSITGFFSQSQNKPVGTFAGAFNNDGTFSGSIVYNASDVTLLPTATERALYPVAPGGRPIVGKMAATSIANTSGTGFSGDFVMTINSVQRAGNFEATIGGSEANSFYFGTYTEPNISDGVFINGVTGDFELDNLLERPSIYPPVFGDIIALNLSIDLQGSILGTLGGRTFSGRATNDGRFTGVWDGNSVRGVITKQTIRVVTSVTVNPTTGVVDITYGERAGFAGNLVVTVRGTEFTASIAGVGGSTAA